MKVELQINENYQEKKIIIQANEIDDEIKEIMEKISQKRKLHKVFLDDEIYMVREDDIESVYTQKGKVYVRAKDKIYLSKKRLYEFEEILSKNKFLRISNSEIVNFDKIKNFNLQFINTISVNFYSGYQTYVSRRYIKKIKEFLKM